MWRLVVGLVAACWLGACNQIFGIPNVTPGDPSQGPVDAGAEDAGDGMGPLGLDLQLLAGDIGGPGNADGTGAGARFNFPAGVAVDRSGNLYIADTTNSTIRKVTPTGLVVTLAGVAGQTGSADGTGSAARFNGPTGVAADSAGNLVVADSRNHTIRRVSATGTVTTLAGVAGAAGSSDGMGAAARFNNPFGVAITSAGNIYVADNNNHTIRAVDIDGGVTTLAGMAGLGGSADGKGAAARFFFPTGVAADAGGNVYVADQNNMAIRKIAADGTVTTFAGTLQATGSTDGTGAAARFSGPTGVATDSAGNVFVADLFNCTIRKITSAGVVTTLAGSVGKPGNADGTGSAARFEFPSGVAADGAGNIYVADQSNSSIRKVTAGGGVTTLAGASTAPGIVNGTGAAARFDQPTGVAIDRTGNVYVADLNNAAVRQVTPGGVVTTLAVTAALATPTGVAVDGAGTVYATNQNDDTILQVSPLGVVTTLAGSSGNSGGSDGTGAAAQFNNPMGLAIDSAGNLYVADQNNCTIRKIAPGGIVTTLAGTAGMPGSADGKGAAARFAFPTGVAVDGAGNVYVADTNNATIRKITPAGVVTTLAGTAGMPGSADGTGTAVRFNNPTGLAVDSAGNLYVADTSNAILRKVSPAGVVTTVAGISGVAGIRLGAMPRFASPAGLAISGDSLFVSDANAILVLRHLP